MPKRYRLLTRAQIHGAVRDPGYVFTLEDGELGPHRTSVASNHGAQIADHMDQQSPLRDIPLYEEIDEGLEKEREEMRTRHAKERDDLEGGSERAALIRKQSQESADLSVREAERTVALRHEREKAELEETQKQEVAGLESVEAKPKVLVPVETNAEALKRRHDDEVKAMEVRHAADLKVLENQKAAAKRSAAKAEGDPLLLDPPVHTVGKPLYEAGRDVPGAPRTPARAAFEAGRDQPKPADTTYGD